MSLYLSFYSFINIFVSQGVPVGLPAGPALGHLGMGPCAMGLPMVPPAPPCSVQLLVGVLIFNLWYYLGFLCSALCGLFFFIFQAHGHRHQPSPALSVEGDGTAGRHS